VKVARHEARLEEIPIPRLRDDYILVKTIAVALNPADWQDLDEPFRPGTTRSLLGIDAAGIVIEVGKSVTKSFKKGDRIAGCSHGANDLEPEDGTFAEYIVVKGDLAFKLPDYMSFEEGSTLSVGISTVMHGLYKHFDFPFPDAKDEGKAKQGGEPILIYGGSSATGTLAIQFAKL
jgi:NADPH:quinone reductase-like Zn-dependent oxidoreductase